MNMYTQDLSLFDFAFSDHVIESLSRTSPLSFSMPSEPTEYKPPMRNRSPPLHRHDGTSPLPLGMDWSLPPRKWDGRDTIWPHDPHTGWSYCITIPSWVILPKASGSDSVVLYRVQVGVQSPEGVTTTRVILRRFNEFLKLLSELKNTFPQKSLPPAPRRRLIRIKTRTSLEERRRSLEEWMEKLLSDINISRSAPVAIFLELEAVARSSFDDMNQISNATSSAFRFQPRSDVSVLGANSSVASDYGYDSFSEKSEIGTPRSDQDLTGPIRAGVNYGMSDNNSSLVIGDSHQENRHNLQVTRGNSDAGERISKAAAPRGDEVEILSEMGSGKLAGHIQTSSTESIGSEISSGRPSEILTSGRANSVDDGSHNLSEGSEVPRTVDNLTNLHLEFPNDLVVALPSEERHKMNRVLRTMQHRLVTIKTDMEDLIARLNQELAVRQCLTTKVKDLEVELETTRQSCKDNMQQAILIERERFTQMQWDMEELRRKCLETELKLQAEQEEKSQAESTKASIIQENQALLQELDVTREQLVKLQRNHEEFETKSKADVKLLVKEVKSLRNSHTELKQELGRVLKEKIEVERALQKEKKRRELGDAANSKLLHECEILHKRLLECSVNFLIEEEDKLTVDASSPSDAIDLLTTSDNRIGLLLAEAQLLAQDVESSMAEVYGNDTGDTTDDQLRKMLTDVFIDNATLRKQVNSVIRCTLNTTAALSKNEDDDDDSDDEEVPLRKTVLSKFLER